MTVERFLLGLRAMEQQGREIAHAATAKEMTPQRVVGLMLYREEELSGEEKVALSQVCQCHSEIKRASALFQFFARMLRERQGEELDDWFHAAFHAGVPELRACVNKVRQDQQAVQAGLVPNGTTALSRTMSIV